MNVHLELIVCYLYEKLSIMLPSGRVPTFKVMDNERQRDRHTHTPVADPVFWVRGKGGA